MNNPWMIIFVDSMVIIVVAGLSGLIAYTWMKIHTGRGGVVARGLLGSSAIVLLAASLPILIASLLGLFYRLNWEGIIDLKLIFAIAITSVLSGVTSHYLDL